MTPFRITQTGVAVDQLKAIIDRARTEGRLKEIVDAGKLALSQLATDPSSVGESRGEYPVIQITKRVGFFGPLTVYYGVDERTRMVTVVSFWLPPMR